MADDARITPPDLNEVHESFQPGTGFFQLLRLLEKDGSEFGRGNAPAGEPARIGQSMRLSFATQDNAGFVPASEGMPARVETMTIGLMGPDAPMPLHLTRWALDRLSNRWFAGDTHGVTSDTSFVDFCNMLQHRAISLYYRAWADTRPEVQIERDRKARLIQMLMALSGSSSVGTEAMAGIKLGQTASLAQQVRAPERLEVFLSEVIGAPVRVEEFVGHWMDVRPSLQTRLGQAYHGLGRTAVIGTRSFQRADCVELRIGPVGLADFESFMLGSEKTEVLREAILFAAGQDVTFDLRIILERSEIPAARLGEAQLSLSSWLAPTRAAHAEDACRRGIVGAPEMAKEAA